jgi:hypothetical protein
MEPLTIAALSLGALQGSKSLTARQKYQPVNPKSTEINMPQNQSSLNKLASVVGIANAGRGIHDQVTTNQPAPPQNTVAPTQQSIQNQNVASYNPMETKLNEQSILSQHEQNLKTFQAAEMQLNSMPQDQRAIYYPPFYETVMKYNQDYKAGRFS